MPTTSEWLDEAGLARSTGYEILKESTGDIDAAIAEALQVCGIRGARHAALAPVYRPKALFGISRLAETPLPSTAVNGGRTGHPARLCSHWS